MHVLWITRQDPRPADSGEFIYTLGLLRSLAETGKIRLTVLAHRADTEPASGEGDGIDWRLHGIIPKKTPLSLLGPLPGDAARLGNPPMRKALGGLFEGSDVDAVVIDQAACGWALSHIPDEIPIYYVAHNHETTVRREVALEHDGPLPLRLALRRDAALYAALEHRLCARARGIAAITPRDEAAFRLDFPDKPYLQLPPGFRGPIPDRLPPISESTPRRVVLAGTFAWIAKRRNLEAFLAAAAPVFPAHGIGFHVVGKSAPGYFESLAARHPWASFAANVPLMAPHLADARIGLIPEALGGGFKLKALDYVFRGLPLAAVEPALSGLPLEPGTSALAAADLDALARLVVEKIDNLEFLNRCAATALENCRDAFRWSDRGRLLADFLIADRPASAGQSS